MSATDGEHSEIYSPEDCRAFTEAEEDLRSEVDLSNVHLYLTFEHDQAGELLTLMYEAELTEKAAEEREDTKQTEGRYNVDLSGEDIPPGSVYQAWVDHFAELDTGSTEWENWE